MLTWAALSAGSNPCVIKEFVYPTAWDGHYPKGVQEYYRQHPKVKPSAKKKALIDRHLDLARTRWDLIANSRIGIVQPNTLTDRQILDTRLESAHPPAVAALGQDRDVAYGRISYHLKARPSPYRSFEAFVDFANPEMGGGVMESGFAQEEILLLETSFLPWVAALQARPARGVNIFREVSLKELDRKPVVVRLRRFLEVANADQVYGRKLEGAKPFDPARCLVPLPSPMDIYVTAMAAPDLRRNRGSVPQPYPQPTIAAMVVLATRAFYDTLLAQAKDGKPLVIHTGNWGCGAFGNSRRTVWAIQRVAMETAYLLFCRQTGTQPPMDFYYDAYDQPSVAEANEASNRFSTSPAKATVEVYTRWICQMTHVFPAWQTKP
jgi:hypothetical protein